MSKAIGVIGLSYGDEGKGATVDYLCRKKDISYVIRFNGGPQAAHNVVEPKGRWHCFSQFGSGTLIKGVKTHLNKNVLIEPTNLFIELAALQSKGITNALPRLSIDPECRIITPWNKMIGQLQEVSRGTYKHGSVGMGVGNAVYDSGTGEEYIIRVKDVFNNSYLKKKIRFIYENKLSEAAQIINGSNIAQLRETYSRFYHYTPEKIYESLGFFRSNIVNNVKSDEKIIQDSINSGKSIVFEGAQGTLLDPEIGCSPYVSKTPCTTKFLEQFIEPWKEKLELETIGVLRAYSHRHGPGPLIAENELLNMTLIEEHNQHNQWQGYFRNGWFDLVLAKYALQHNTIHSVYMTCFDSLSFLDKIGVCAEYYDSKNSVKQIPAYLTKEFFSDSKPNIVDMDGWKDNSKNYQYVKNYVSFLSEELKTKISNISFGKTYAHRLNMS
jgi:adenylosuccinate synthase